MSPSKPIRDSPEASGESREGGSATKEHVELKSWVSGENSQKRGEIPLARLTLPR
ncbi:MAG: hypothetical protein ACI8UO_004199 [Verrucomicrobiales bacterium]|jgi:hypothetical protein